MATRSNKTASSATAQAAAPTMDLAQMQAMMMQMMQQIQGIQAPAEKAKAETKAKAADAKPSKTFLEVEYGGKGIEATLADGRKILIKRMRSGKGLYAEVIGK
jgi:predicted transglutaminase-like cysteine proteinase